MPQRPKGPPPGERPPQPPHDQLRQSVPLSEIPSEAEVINFKGRGRVATPEEQSDAFTQQKKRLILELEGGLAFPEVEEVDLATLPDGALVYISGSHPSAVYILHKIGDQVRIYNGLYGNPIVVGLDDINRSVEFRGVKRLRLAHGLRKGHRVDMPYFEYAKDAGGSRSVLQDPQTTWSDTIQALRILLPELQGGRETE